MTNQFDISGLFYEIRGLECRKYLDIKRTQSKLTTPDLMVVMMNPGSSYPLDGITDNSKPSRAVPDKTQNQIIKVMNNVHYDFTRILNLSDLRTPKSEDLFKFLKSPSSKIVPHSIFGVDRQRDFETLYIQNIPVIFAWGVDKALYDLAKQTIAKINNPNPNGINKNKYEYAYYHPLPRKFKQQNEWVENISRQLDLIESNMNSQ